MTEKISVILPVRNEEKYISRCLDSILAQDYPSDLVEILVVDGMSDDGTREIIKEYAKKHKNIKIIDNPYRTTPIAFNSGIRNSSGEIVGIVSAHSALPSDYIAKCVYFLHKTGADNVGGICKHRGENFIGSAIALAQECRFGMGGAKFRTAIKEEYVDTLFPGAWRRKTFEKYGYFNEKLIRNQDIEHNARIRKGGGKIFLTPEIISYYFCRSSLKNLWIQNIRNGFWNIKTVSIAPYSLSVRHFVPLVFIAGLLTAWVVPALWVSIACSYIVANMVFSTKIAFESGAKYLLIMPPVFITIHFSYGLGSLFGLFNLAMDRTIKLFRMARWKAM